MIFRHNPANGRKAFLRAIHAQDGAIAVEFALAVPLLVVLLLGVVEIGNYLTVERRVFLAAKAVAESIAGKATTSSDEVGELVGAAREIVKPYDSSSIRATITSFTSFPVGSSQANTCWIYQYNGGASPIAGSSNDSVEGTLIVVRMDYTYSARSSGMFFPVSTTIQKTFAAKPRKALFVRMNYETCKITG